MPIKRTLIHIVTYNNAQTIKACIQSVLPLLSRSEKEQGPDHSVFELIVTDNASIDDTPTIVQATLPPGASFIANISNQGFCSAHNAAFHSARKNNFDFVFILNPDAALTPDALSYLVEALANDPFSGCATPLILRCNQALEPLVPEIVDAAGMYLTFSSRHFDRNAGETLPLTDTKPQYVFGATGAAALYKMSMLVDCALPSPLENSLQVFDDLFFAYREDADLSWRTQWLGWRTLFVPKAIVYHERRALPENRSLLPSEVNAYSVRNRFLLQANNFPRCSFFYGGLRANCCTIWRNVLVILAVILKERTSFRALISFVFLRSRAKRNYNFLQRKRQVTWCYLTRLFSYRAPSNYIANADKPVRKQDRELLHYSPMPLEPLLQTKSNGSKPSSLNIIIINYNSEELLEACLKELDDGLEQSPAIASLKIIIWDNASQDNSAQLGARLASVSKLITLHLSSCNLGFAAAINEACRLYPAERFLILNPDIKIKGKDIERLLVSLNSFDNLGAIAPVLCNPDGSAQLGFTARSFPGAMVLLAECFGLHKLWPNNPWSEHYRNPGGQLFRDYITHSNQGLSYPESTPPSRIPADYPFAVDQPAGAALMFKSEAFSCVNGFDPAFFPAWFEDVDFLLRLRQSGWQSAVLATATATHKGGYSLEFLGKNGFARCWFPNMIRYLRKHFPRFISLAAEFAVRLALLFRGLLCLVGKGRGLSSSTCFQLALGRIKKAKHVDTKKEP